MKIGYARVSTDEQNLDLQRQALHDAGCDLILEDKAGGAHTSRSGLTDALTRCTAGDVLVVWKLDRLGRSLTDLARLIEELNSRGVGLKILTGQGAQVDTTKPDGRMIFGILATLAQFERELIGERTKAGMAAAKRRGVRVGRPAKLTPFKIAEARDMISVGKSRIDVAELLGISPITLRRALRE